MDEEEASNQHLSTQKVLLPSHDPGWNDPPKWAYSGGTGGTGGTATPTKRILNKRVAFPLGAVKADAKDTLSETKSPNLPPPVQCPSNLTTASHPPLLNPSNKNADAVNDEIKIDKEKALSDVLENLEAVINENILEKYRVEEVRKRLGILKSAWVEDKLNDTVYKNILELSTALKAGDIEKADQIHVTLMMQHAGLCSSWIPGIRHIILELKTKTQNSSAIQSESSESHLLTVGQKDS